jgi:hypothetical protein
MIGIRVSAQSGSYLLEKTRSSNKICQFNEPFNACKQDSALIRNKKTKYCENVVSKSSTGATLSRLIKSYSDFI